MKVKVLVRTRPLLAEEAEGGHAATMLRLDPAGRRIDLAGKTFEADHVCGPQSSQEDVYRLGDLEVLARSTCEVYNATVFAYG